MKSSLARSPLPKVPMFRGLAMIGGHPALDFVNTVKYRGACDPQDKLESMADIIGWCQVSGLLSDTEVRKLSRQSASALQSPQTFQEICDFRADVHLLLQNRGSRTRPYKQAALRVAAAITALNPIATIDLDTGELQQSIVIKMAEDVMARIAAAVADLLSNYPGERLKTCHGDDCDWLFVDRTKAGQRRWCDSRTCGNIARVRQFRRKHS